MSKFVEKLKNHTQKSPAPLGFGKTTASEKPKMLLVALITDADNENIGERVKGADAVFVSSDSTGSLMKAMPGLNKANPDVLWGGFSKNTEPENIDIKNITADFLVFSPETPLFEMPDKTGKILAIDDVITDTQLRAVDELPVDAVFFVVRPELLNWQYLIKLQRLDNLLSKPLLAAVPSNVTINELLTLWSVGVDGIVIEATASGKLKALREEIDKTVFPLPRKSKKLDVRIPFVNPSSAEEFDEGEDE